MKSPIVRLFVAIALLTGAALLSAQEQKSNDDKKPIVLFDGSSTTGWKQSGPGGFKIIDGALVSSGGMGLFWHEREFGDFLLTLEFKVDKKETNSGVFVRFPDPGNDPWVAVIKGHEIQICDTQEGNQTGAIYDSRNSRELASKPVGEWNQYEIKVIGQKYTITLNGKVVNEYTSARSARGHIGLQNHDDSAIAHFRSIKVIDLDEKPGAPAATPPAAAPDKDKKPEAAATPPAAPAPATPAAVAAAPAPVAPAPEAAAAPVTPETPAAAAPVPVAAAAPAPVPAPAPVAPPAAPKAEPKPAATPTAPTITVAEPPAAPLPPHLGRGLVGKYYKNHKSLAELDASNKAPYLVRVDKHINYPRINGQFYKSKLAGNFAVRWSGMIHVDSPGEYVFTLQSDDGSRLYVGDHLIVDNEPCSAWHEKSGPAQLAAGDYPIRIDYTNGAGEAGIFLFWQRPGSTGKSIVPASILYHAKADELVGWDRDAWTRATFSSKKSKAEQGAMAEKMDYGPFISHTLAASKGNTVLKGVAIKLGKNEEAGVVFDTELLRYGAGWTGGFLNLTGVVFDGGHGTNPTPEGDVLFATANEPGARAISSVDGKPFADPRAKPFGPLPREWGRYQGLYRNGEKVIVSYTVGTATVLDMPGYETIGKEPIFTRTIDVGTSDVPVTLLITGSEKINDKDSPTAVAYPSTVTLTKGEGGRRYITFPASLWPRTYKIAIARGNGAVPPADLLKTIANPENIRALCTGGPAQYQPINTQGELGQGEGPYVVDTLTAPEENPFNSWLRFGGVDFFSNGTQAALCTWSGDVWIVSGIDANLSNLTWKRYATGMFQTLGLRIVNDQVYVLGRDQITRLHDLNQDGEADFYECFNNDCQVSDSFHEFAFDLQTDSKGNFYFSKAGPVRPGGRGWQTITDHNGSMLRVSADGKKFDVFATGVRAPNGMGVGPDDTITIADNEGTWTPACRLNIVKPGTFIGVPDLSHTNPPPTDYARPICWFPHGDVDNSSGGQVWVESERWGPFTGELLHMSYGKCSLFKVMKEQVGDIWQGGVVKFPLQFLTGICRARFNALDGQLYVTGLRGWQTDATKDGAFQRVRYTGKPVNMPTGIHVRPDGIEVTFTGALDPTTANDVQNYAIEQWNYLWSSDYGSPEFSVENPKEKGHDPVEVETATLSPDQKTVFLKITDLKPVMQMKIQMKLKTAMIEPCEHTIYSTINAIPGATGGTPQTATAK